MELKILADRSKYIVHGFVIVRKELGAISIKKVIDLGEGKETKLQTALLSLYDYITFGHSYPLDDEMVNIAYEYFKAYAGEGGNKSWNEIENDFNIVACASQNKADIVVSEDNKTMLSEKAVKAYEKINFDKQLAMPSFYHVADIKKEIQEENLGGVRLD